MSVLLFLSIGCFKPVERADTDADTDTDSDTDADTDSDTDADTDSDTDADTDSDTDTDTDTDTDSDTDADTDSDTDSDTDADTDSDTDTDPCDDVYEPNDSFSSRATNLPAAGADDLVHVNGEDDWYAVTIAPNDVCTFTLLQVDDVDLDLELVDEGGNLLADRVAAQGFDPPAELTWFHQGTTPLEGAINVLDLSDNNPACTPYDLEISCTACDDDSLEDNDTSGQAIPISPGSQDLMLTDEDWFSIEVPPLERLLVSVAGDIRDIEIFHSAGSEASFFDNEVDYYNPSATDSELVNVVVRPDQGACGPYTLDASLEVSPDCSTNDSEENNDTLANPSPVSVGTLTGLNTSNSDPDYYRVNLPAGHEILVTIDNLDEDWFDLETYLYDGSDFEVDSDTFSTYDLDYVNTDNAVQQMKIGVLVPDAGGCAHNEITISTRLCLSTDDNLEPNEGFTETVEVVSGSTLTLTDASDEDWFLIGEVGAGQTVTVDLFFLHAGGDIDLRLYSDQSTDVADYLEYGGSSSDDESVSWTNQSPSPITVVARAWWFYDSTTCSQDYVIEHAIF